MRALREICQREYFPLNLRIRSDKTLYQYEIALCCFSRFLGREALDTDLSDDTIALWMGSLLRQRHASTGKALSVNTVRERVNRILALWAWLAKRTPGMRWPTVVKPQAPESLPVAMTEEQLRRFFLSARKERGKIGPVPADDWCLSFFGFVWCSAERKSAALAVRISWIDLPGRVVRIPPYCRKGGLKWGVYALWPELIPLLERCIAADPTRELMWPWPKCSKSYYTMYDRILRDAGIPVDRQHKTHSLRVSHATFLKALGGDPTRQLGHDSPTTTDRHYIDKTKLPIEPNVLPIPWDNGPRPAA